VRLIIEKRKLIDDDYRNDLRNTCLFMELIRTPYNLYSILRRMTRYGVLGQYLPEFGRVIGMMQYDLFHIYTVDAHTLMVLRQMRRMRYESTREQLPLAHEVFYRLPKPELLYLSGLYHYIAQGRCGDHFKVGGADATRVLRTLRFVGLGRQDAGVASAQPPVNVSDSAAQRYF